MYIPKEGEKTVEGEDGVKVVVEKTFWQKYVWLLFFHFKAVCFGLFWLGLFLFLLPEVCAMRIHVYLS